ASGDIVQFQPGHPLQPQQRYSDLLTIQFETTLPIFRKTRQTPRLAAKEKELDAARASTEDAKRKQRSELRQMIVVWETHRDETMRIRDELIPLQFQKREAALAAYRGGTGTLDAVLQARRDELDARLRLVQHQQLAANAWAWLEYVFPLAEQ